MQEVIRRYANPRISIRPKTMKKLPGGHYVIDLAQEFKLVVDQGPGPAVFHTVSETSTGRLICSCSPEGDNKTETTSCCSHKLALAERERTEFVKERLDVLNDQWASERAMVYIGARK